MRGTHARSSAYATAAASRRLTAPPARLAPIIQTSVSITHHLENCRASHATQLQLLLKNKRSCTLTHRNAIHAQAFDRQVHFLRVVSTRQPDPASRPHFIQADHFSGGV